MAKDSDGELLPNRRNGVHVEQPPHAAFGALLAVLYGFLYVILHSEDYALLLGALLLFTALAIVMAGARPVFADIDPERLTLDPRAAASATTRASISPASR